MEAQTTHHKIKAEWTRSSASEAYEESSCEFVKTEKNTNLKCGKIKILEQIVLCPSSNESVKAVNEIKQDKKLADEKGKKTSNKKTEDVKSKKCQVCEKSFPIRNFEEHVKSHSLFECTEPDCFKKFKRKSSLRKHMYVHKGKFKYVCEDCKETFIDKCKYQVHIASRHKKIDRVYECKECSKTFTSADYLRKHQITHKDEFPYPCTMCNQKFKWLTSLQAHNMIHTQNKTIVQCKECFKRFFNQRTLDRHMKIHQNVKYSCTVCNSVVSIRKDNVMRHIRHLHNEISRNDIFKYIHTVGDLKEDRTDTLTKSIMTENEAGEIDINDDDDDDSNDLVIDESVQEEEEPLVLEIQKPIINNRVNVIQSIGNPNKNQQIIQNDIPTFINANTSTEISEEYNNKTDDNSKIQLFNNINSQQDQHEKADDAEIEIQLPPKKKAIAKYNPIEHYRKILGLSETNTSTTAKQNEESSEQVFPDHWRKRTSQNFLFRR